MLSLDMLTPDMLSLDTYMLLPDICYANT